MLCKVSKFVLIKLVFNKPICAKSGLKLTKIFNFRRYQVVVIGNFN